MLSFSGVMGQIGRIVYMYNPPYSYLVERGLLNHQNPHVIGARI